MVQWINSSINLMSLPLLCEAAALVQPGLMATRLAGRQNTTTFRDF